jgi:Ca2+-binding RTX toxin-like protein
MSLIRKVGRRGRRTAALTTVGALFAFQALAIIGAGAASAVTNCTYNPATDSLSVVIDPGATAALGVDDPSGAILLNGVACGSATNANTTSIVVLGQPSANEQLVIDNFTGLEFSTAITWAIDLGTGAGDIFAIVAADTADTITVTDSSFDLNGGGGELNGVDVIALVGNGGDDTLDASAASVFVALQGGTGDDWLADGSADDSGGGLGVTGGAGVDTVYEGTAANGDDSLDGGGQVGDTLDYGDRTGDILVGAGVAAGEDINGNGVPNPGVDEIDTITGFDTYVTGSGDDTIVGSAANETFRPGDGNDDVDGGGGADLLDYSTSSAGVTIDPDAGTVSGQGDDTVANVEAFLGSPLDDTLIWPTTPVAFSGGDGVDLVDASAQTSGVTIDLTGPLFINPLFTADTVENVTGGSGNDTLIGNTLQNVLDGGEGNDGLAGNGGNDTLIGRGGNDAYSGGTGADKAVFKYSPNGIDLDASLGFSSGEGDDVLAGDLEIFVGTDFADDMTTGLTAGGGATNFRVKGRAGNDNITGSNSNDTLSGGKGNDKIRGGKGDDTLKGNKGKDEGWGGGGDDFCKSIEKEHSC